VTIGDPNTEGYQIMADILVTLRRIVHRGLEKIAGSTWYLDGLPEGLFERLVERKEKEASIDRFNGEYQELISFASLDDLAEIVEFNDELAKLLSGIGPDETTLVERLRQIEALRLKLAATAPFDDDDLEELVEYHQDLKRALSRRKKQAVDPSPPESRADLGSPEAEDADPVDERPSGEPEQEPTEEAMPVEDPENTQSDAADSTEDAGERAAVSDVNPYATEMAKVEELSQADIVTADAYGTVAARLEVPQDEPASETGAEASEIEQAVAADDDRAALEILRREVMSVAEAVLQNDPPQEYPVWESLGLTGWLNRKRDELGLEPVERFYRVAEGVLEMRLAGHSADEVKEFIDRSRFSSLLLELRELFMKHQL
jgi:hypothetical protein